MCIGNGQLMAKRRNADGSGVGNTGAVNAVSAMGVNKSTNRLAFRGSNLPISTLMAANPAAFGATP